MASTKRRKVGERIFYERYDGTIGTATIKKIEPTESPFDRQTLQTNSDNYSLSMVLTKGMMT